MKNQTLLLPAVIVTLTGVTLLLSARQEGDKAADSPSASPAAPRPSDASDPLPPAPERDKPAQAVKSAKLSYGLDEIAKMVQAGVDQEVVQAFIENSTIAYAPNADDIVHLRALGAPPQVVASLIRHGGGLREQGIQESRAAQGQWSQPSSPAVNYPATPSSFATSAPQAASVTYNVFNSSSPADAYPVYPTYSYVAPPPFCYPRYSYSYPRYYFRRHHFPTYYGSCSSFTGYSYYAPRFVRYGVAMGFGSYRSCRPARTIYGGIRL